MIYTIGYQRLDIEQLDAILAELSAQLVDVRSVPYSRRPEFRQAALRQRYQDRYVLAGHWLGGIPRGRTHDQTTPAGIAWLRQFDGSDQLHVVLMCMEHNPSACHRHSLICGPHFPDARHIYQGRVYAASDLNQAIASPVQVALEPIGCLAVPTPR